MRSFFQKLYSNRIIPIAWTLITIVLLCLPGSSLPGEGFVFHIPHFDKIVHVILFGGIVFFWGCYFAFRSRQLVRQHWQRLVILLAVLSTGLGIVLEFVQFNFIPQRSFDRGDIVADAAGALAAMASLLLYYSRRLIKA